MSHALIDSPIGKLLIVTTDHGVTRIAFAELEPDDASNLAAAHAPSKAADAVLKRAERELGDYFAGKLRNFTVPVLLDGVSPFRRKALDAIASIGYGETLSYSEVALETGNPKAVRAVGTACATNPVPLIVPCHRVTKTGGAVGNYGGGPEAKRLLIDLERRTSAGTSA